MLIILSKSHWTIKDFRFRGGFIENWQEDMVFYAPPFFQYLLRPPLGSKYYKGDKALAKLELDANLKLVSFPKGKVLWKRDELYIDSESYSLGEFKLQERKNSTPVRARY